MDNFLSSQKNRFELLRIAWRVRVMQMPGGVQWLLAQCRKWKFKETRLRPDLGLPA